jgi:predicted  nucleic acid-binding Zn-ribbon protein
MLRRLQRRRSLANSRVQALEHRVDRLETQLEGLQDAIHRDAVRRDEQHAELERKTEPDAMARSLNRDARRRGL